jgi:transcriptional regulator with XRE-family HTH domain
MPACAPPRRAVARTLPDKSDQSIAAKLKRLVAAKARGRSINDIAEAAGMPASMLSQIINGHTAEPRFSTVYRLLKALPATLADYDRA